MEDAIRDALIGAGQGLLGSGTELLGDAIQRDRQVDTQSRMDKLALSRIDSTNKLNEESKHRTSGSGIGNPDTGKEYTNAELAVAKGPKMPMYKIKQKVASEGILTSAQAQAGAFQDPTVMQARGVMASEDLSNKEAVEKMRVTQAVAMDDARFKATMGRLDEMFKDQPELALAAKKSAVGLKQTAAKPRDPNVILDRANQIDALMQDKKGSVVLANDIAAISKLTGKAPEMVSSVDIANYQHDVARVGFIVGNGAVDTIKADAEIFQKALLEEKDEAVQADMIEKLMKNKKDVFSYLYPGKEIVDETTETTPLLREGVPERVEELTKSTKSKIGNIKLYTGVVLSSLDKFWKSIHNDLYDQKGGAARGILGE